MKRILFFLLMIVGVAHAQITPSTPTIPGFTKINDKYNWLGGRFAMLTLPAYGDTGLVTGQNRMAGHVIIDTTGSNKGLYIYYDGYFHRVALSTEGSTVTASNGLTKTGNDIAIGGTMTTDIEIDADGNDFTISSAGTITLNASGASHDLFLSTDNGNMTLTGGNGVTLYTTSSGISATFRPDSMIFYPYRGRVRFDTLNHQNSTANTVMVYDSLTGAVGHVATSSLGGGSVATVNVTEGIAKRNDSLIIDNNRNIYYITQPSTGSSIPSTFTAVGTPGLTFSNGVWVWAGNANNNTQYIRSNAGVLAEGSYIEGYTIIDSVRASSIGFGPVFKSYNTFSGGIYAHDVEFRYVTGSSATNYGKATIYGKTGNSTTASTATREANPGDTIYWRADRDGIGYTWRVKNITQGWKLQTTVQCTPGGSPFTPNNSAYVAFSPAGGGYRTYGVKYVIKAPIQTDLCIVGNSIAQRQGTVIEGAGFASLVGNRVNNVIMGGGADGITEMLARVGEIIAIHPRAVLMEAPGNDVLFDGSLTSTTRTEYTAFRDSIVAHGIEFIHTLPTPRTATDESSLKDWIDTTSTFRSDRKIDLWTPLLGSGTSLATKYNLDGTHPNAAGHAQIASTINYTLHYNNGDGLYATRNVYAFNGRMVAQTQGTSDVNSLGGFTVIPQNGDTTRQGNFYRMSGYVGIEGRTLGASYDPVVVGEFGNARFGVGNTSPDAPIEVNAPGSGTVRAQTWNKTGAYSAEGQEVQLHFQNAGTDIARIAQYLGPSTSYGFKFWGYSGGAINSNPVLWLRGLGNKVGIGVSSEPISALQVVGSIRNSDSLVLTSITQNGQDTTNTKLLVRNTSTGNVTATNWNISSLIDHGNLVGLADDDHTQYALLAGRNISQTLTGSVTADQGLVLKANSAGAGNTATTSAITALVGNSGLTTAWTARNSGEVAFSNAITMPIASVSTNTTLDATHYTLKFDATGGALTATLPAAAGCSGRIYVIKKSDNSVNTVTIDGNSSETIDGATTKVINLQYGGYMIQSDGTGWNIISTF